MSYQNCSYFHNNVYILHIFRYVHNFHKNITFHCGKVLVQLLKNHLIILYLTIVVWDFELCPLCFSVLQLSLLHGPDSCGTSSSKTSKAIAVIIFNYLLRISAHFKKAKCQKGRISIFETPGFLILCVLPSDIQQIKT